MYSVIFFFVITTAVCDRLFPYKEVSVLREIFVYKVNAIGRDGFMMCTAMIIMMDGTRHITQTWSIDDRDPDSPTVEYVEVHAISSGYRVRVRYDLIEDVVEYSGDLECIHDPPMTRVQFIEALTSIRKSVRNDHHRVHISLSDGACHLVSLQTIDYTGSERASYREVYHGHSLYRMSVGYTMIVRVVDYAPLKFVSGQS